MPAMADALLRVHDLACRRGDRLLFSGLDFALGAGEALIVEGPNGAGKTSLMKMVAGLLRPVAGRVERPMPMAFLAHELALDLDLPLARALGLWARLDGAGPAAIARALTEVALAPLAEVPVRMLSSGQRRRAGLARVIAAGAPLWLLDEPGVGLDVAALDRLAATMAAHRAAGGAILVTTHMPLGLDGCRRLAIGAVA